MIGLWGPVRHPARCSGREVPHLERALAEAKRYDLMILDAPTHAEQGGREMAKASDLVIMPTGYSLDDMEPQTEAA